MNSTIKTIAPQHFCARCGDTGQRRGVRWPDGFICRRCYQRATRHRGVCPGCALPNRLLPELNSHGDRICIDCAGINDPRLTCTRCGDQDEPHRRGLCARCCLTDDLTDLFTASDADQITPELQPLLEARVVIENFKDDHNNRHRHFSLGYLTPAEYAAQCTHAHQPVDACEID